jgi:hypothetical protein
MADYPINYHILAEDFREQAAGRKAYNQGDGEWLHDALVKMCNAYDNVVEAAEAWLKFDNEVEPPMANASYGEHLAYERQKAAITEAVAATLTEKE